MNSNKSWSIEIILYNNAKPQDVKTIEIAGWNIEFLLCHHIPRTSCQETIISSSNNSGNTFKNKGSMDHFPHRF